MWREGSERNSSNLHTLMSLKKLFEMFELDVCSFQFLIENLTYSHFLFYKHTCIF